MPETPERPERLLTERDAAHVLGVTVHYMRRARHYGDRDLPFVRMGKRIRYLESDLQKWINDNCKKYHSTAEYKEDYGFQRGEKKTKK